MATSASDGDLLKHSAVQENEGANRQQQAAAWEEQRVESKYARTLEQLPPDRKISPQPNDWVCDSTGVTENLWLNLSTGHIGSGRMHWDGSGGNGVASSLLPNCQLHMCTVAACTRAAGSCQWPGVSCPFVSSGGVSRADFLSVCWRVGSTLAVPLECVIMVTAVHEKLPATNVLSNQASEQPSI